MFPTHPLCVVFLKERASRARACTPVYLRCAFVLCVCVCVRVCACVCVCVCVCVFGACVCV